MGCVPLRTCVEADIECYSTRVGWERDWGPRELEVAVKCLGSENQKTLDHDFMWVSCVWRGGICVSRAPGFHLGEDGQVGEGLRGFSALIGEPSGWDRAAQF